MKLVAVRRLVAIVIILMLSGSACRADESAGSDIAAVTPAAGASATTTVAPTNSAISTATEPTTSTPTTVPPSIPPKPRTLSAVEVEVIRRADQAITKRDFAAAIELLTPLEAERPGDDRVERRLHAARTYAEQSTASAPYDGPVAHLFTHSLIVDTEAAFDGDFMASGYYDYMITVGEFEAILQQLHERRYILIDIHELFDEALDGTITPRPLRFPPGRKPFVLSVDDVSYYDYMTTDGFAEALVIDDDANVATRLIDEAGGFKETLDGDVVPILDQFIWDNPDFSYQGAKGILAVTGYEGAFGYDVSRDQVDQPDFDQRFSDLTKVAERLRELGWTFASHSYTHSQDIKNKSMSLKRFVFDSDNWEREIGAAIGPTDIYISPFGAYFSDDDPRYRHLIDDKGFNVFNPISDGTTIEWRNDNLVFHRLSIDGYMLDHGAKRLAPYFDADEVRDPARAAARR